MTDLAAIRNKVRRITSRSTENQLTTADLDSYINTFYQYDLPEHLRLINLKQEYSFFTQPNVDIYNFTPNANVSIEGPVYVGGYQVQLFQDRDTFFSLYPDVQDSATLDTGDGTAGPYSGTITAAPVKRNGRVLVSAIDAAGASLTAIDDNAGSFTGDVAVGATINYVTGAIAALTWTSAITSGNTITVQYVPFSTGRPNSILFFDDTFQLNPVPDQAYEVTMTTYITPTALANATDEPVLREWWQLVAYGAAMKIFADNLDTDSIDKIRALFDEQKRLCERRTLQQIKINRSNTIYSDEIWYRTPFSSGS